MTEHGCGVMDGYTRDLSHNDDASLKSLQPTRDSVPGFPEAAGWLLSRVRLAELFPFGRLNVRTGDDLKFRAACIAKGEAAWNAALLRVCELLE